MMTQAQNLANLSQDYGVIPMSNRNYVVDGQFEQWSAANAALSQIGSYTNAVMYFGACGAGGAGTIQSFVPPGTRNWQWPVKMTSPATGSLEFVQSTASTGSIASGTAPSLSQRIEGGNVLAGCSATFSCWLWVASGSITIPSIILRQNFGTGGSPSAANILDKTVNWVVTTVPTRFSVRIDLPVVTGATFGTNGDDKVPIGLWLPAGVTFSLYTAQWQLEQSNPLSSSDLNGKGGEPTAFEYRGAQAELARVQRYYQTTGQSLLGGYQAASSLVFADFPFFVPMRANPACSLAGTPTYTNASGYVISGAIGPGGIRVQVAITAAGYGYCAGAPITADARL